MRATADTAQASLPVQDVLWEGERVKASSNYIRISAGPGWIISKVATPYRTYSSKSGFELGVDYEHLWSVASVAGTGSYSYGFGINYMYNTTSYDQDIDVV